MIWWRHIRMKLYQVRSWAAREYPVKLPNLQVHRAQRNGKTAWVYSSDEFTTPSATLYLKLRGNILSSFLFTLFKNKLTEVLHLHFLKRQASLPAQLSSVFQVPIRLSLNQSSEWVMENRTPGSKAKLQENKGCMQFSTICRTALRPRHLQFAFVLVGYGSIFHVWA